MRGTGSSRVPLAELAAEDPSAASDAEAAVEWVAGQQGLAGGDWNDRYGLTETGNVAASGSVAGQRHRASSDPLALTVIRRTPGAPSKR